MKDSKGLIQVKAKVSFCGTISANAGHVFLCQEDIAKKMIAAGYVETLEKELAAKRRQEESDD